MQEQRISPAQAEPGASTLPDGVPETADLGQQAVSPSRPNRFALVLFCGGLGILFERMFFGSATELLFPLFFLLCAGAVLVFRRRNLACRGDSLLFFGAALVLSLLFLFGPNGHRQDSDSALILFNIPILPALCMLSAIFAAIPLPLQREGLLVAAFFRSWLYLPFRYLFSFFSPFLALFSGRREVNWAHVLLGLVIALPLSVGVLALLARADTMMEQFLSGLLYRSLPGDLLFRLLFGLAAAVLSHACLYGLCHERRIPAPAAPGGLPGLVAAIPTVCLLLIYLIFGYIQFRYLFGGRLPAEYTYAEYARKGFSEILTVACINLCLFGCTLRYVQPEKTLRFLLPALLTATLLLLASSLLRLWLYIAAYGLTLRRVLSVWFLLYLTVMLGLCFYRLHRRDFPLLRWGLRILTFWYMMLNLPNWPAIFSHWA